MNYDRFDLVTTERVAKLCEWLMVHSGTVTPKVVAARYSVHVDTARDMLMKISRAVPLVEEDGHWWYVENFSEYR
jgi:hypothetical protein